MNGVSLVFPHQLFEEHPALRKNQPVYLVEEFLFFRQYHFHQQKLVFHRASMKAYEAHLQRKGFEVRYIEAKETIADVRELLPSLSRQRVTNIYYSDVVDNYLARRLAQKSQELHLQIHVHPSSLFLLNNDQVKDYFFAKERFFQTDFYIRQRKHFKILVDEKLQPAGGQWTYDAENRLKYPRGKNPPAVSFPAINEYWAEATAYVAANFAANIGAINAAFSYPTTFQESRDWLNDFFRHRFAAFGDYEDALVANEKILHHSVLTPLLNVGLLTPAEVVDAALRYASKNQIPLNSCEGFIRQILGWREFIRGVYEAKGSQERTTNYWNFKRKIPASFWNGTTGIRPIDSTIQKVLATGYCHHIERLMVLGNFMLLCEFDPNEVYRWFMELFIDAYDWVMVPNVYGMSQFADGGMMATKPYISGSNYLMKMSDYGKGDWQKTWDGLFWRFMHTHRDFFLTNPRLGMLVKTFDKMPQEKQAEHLRQAESFLNTLDG